MSDQPQLKEMAVAFSTLTWSQVKAVSVQLNMKLSTLSQIEQQYSTVSDRTLHSIDTWLRNDEPSWARIVAALNAIEENALAARIQQQHCHPMETPPTSPASQAVAASNDPSPPGTQLTDSIPSLSPVQIPSTCIKQPSSPHPMPSPQLTCTPPPPLSSSHEPSVQATRPQAQPERCGVAVVLHDRNRRDEVASKALQMQDQFVRVFTKAKIEFARKPAGFLEELRITLTTLPISERFQHLRFLRKQREHIMEASSVDTIFEILDNYWDYTDYALLQRLVERFGESALKEEMSEYVAALEQFEKRTTIQESDIAASDFSYPKRRVYSGYEFIYGDSRHDFSTVKLQLPRDPAVSSLYEARQVVESAAKRACLEPYAVRLKEVCPGSVAITLMCPRVALELIITALDEGFLKSHQIVSVILDEKPLQEYNQDYVKVCVYVTEGMRSQYFMEMLGFLDLHVSAV